MPPHDPAATGPRRYRPPPPTDSRAVAVPRLLPASTAVSVRLHVRLLPHVTSTGRPVPRPPTDRLAITPVSVTLRAGSGMGSLRLGRGWGQGFEWSVQMLMVAVTGRVCVCVQGRDWVCTPAQTSQRRSHGWDIAQPCYVAYTLYAALCASDTHVVTGQATCHIYVQPPPGHEVLVPSRTTAWLRLPCTVGTPPMSCALEMTGTGAAFSGGSDVCVCGGRLGRLLGC